MKAPEPAPVLLYDGLCGFCDGTVQFILAHDRRGTMRFAALEGAFAARVQARHQDLASVDSLILVFPAAAGGEETVLVRTAAALAIGRYLGGGWQLTSVVLRLIPRRLRDFAYDTFARHRFRWAGRRPACRIPSREQRHRFVE